MASSGNKDEFKIFLRNYWEYYRELEDDFLLTRRYVAFNKDNFNSYSVEYLKLYQAVCSEIDVIGKALAETINPEFKAEDRRNNIYKWWYEIQNKFLISKTSIFGIKYCTEVEEESIQDFENIFLNYFSIKAWDNFVIDKFKAKDKSIRYKLRENCIVPSWWKDYNKVKHHRTSAIEKGQGKNNYTKANFGNLCSAFSALYTLEIAFMELIGTKNDLKAFADYSRLFFKKSNITTEEIGKLFES